MLQINPYNKPFYNFENEIGDPILTNSDILKENEIWAEGATLLKAAYPFLYEAYKDKCGQAEDDDYFILPDYRERVIQGAEDFGYIEAGLPDIQGQLLNFFRHNTLCTGSAAGAFSFKSGSSFADLNSASTSSTSITINFAASESDPVYGASTTVQPPAIKTRVKTRYV